jgi:hypothetical protein
MPALDDEADRDLPLPGDAFVPDARSQITRGITLEAVPAAIWPFLVEMVAERAAPDASRRGEAKYTVLLSDEPRALVLGALHDHGAAKDLPFDHDRPAQFWHATWALVLVPLNEARTRLVARARVAFTIEAVRWSAVWLHPFNDFTDAEALHRLKARVERTS